MHLSFIKYFNITTILVALNYLLLNQTAIAIYFLLINIATMIYYYKINLEIIVKQTFIYLTIAIFILGLTNSSLLGFSNIVFIFVIGIVEFIFIYIIKEYSEYAIEFKLANTLNNAMINLILLIVVIVLFQNDFINFFQYSTYLNNYFGLITIVVISVLPFVFAIKFKEIIYYQAPLYKTIHNIVNVIK